MTRYALPLALAAGILAAPVATAQTPAPAAQAPAAPQQQVVVQDRPSIVMQGDADARETRQQLQQLLRQHPPAVGEVLQRDPSLLQREDYLAPYPVLVAFLRQHPEVARNPSFFFLGDFQFREPDPRRDAQQMTEEILETLGQMGLMFAAFAIFVWLVRTLVDHRRWVRASRVQTEVHLKLMDRLTSNEDLLAYMQTAAGRRFLESAPITVDGEPRAGMAPVQRIIWSLQAGVVLLALGTGFWWIRATVSPEAGEGFSIAAIIVFMLGAGFAASAALAYLISHRLGLITPPRVDHA